LSVIGALVATLFVSLSWGAGAADKMLNRNVVLSVQSLGGPKAMIGVDLEFVGRSPTRIYKSDYPWGNRRSIILVVVCLDGLRTLIPELEYIDDPEPTIVTLQPGLKYHGVISLIERFPTLSSCIASRDALVFWSYQLQPIEGAPVGRLSGGVVVKK
jgi:hypothetical protein